jgi:ketosteroid isomerase-like protein
MSEETIALTRKGIQAFIESDFETWFALASPDIKLYPRDDEPGVKSCYEGWEELLEYLGNWYSGWQDYIFEPIQFIDAGDWVIVDAMETGIAEQSGLRVEESFAHAVRIEDGKFVEWRMFGRLHEALEALGIEIQH